MSINQIERFTFISLEGDPLAISQETVVKSRPGVDNVAIWRTGSRGREFTLRSAVDGFSMVYARNLYYLYRGIIGTAVDAIWNGMALTNADTKLIVLDVKPARGRCFAMLGGVGGESPPSMGWIECDWKLITQDVST